jgi:DNA phosphorothioation-associated putative methyltransferase
MLIVAAQILVPGRGQQKVEFGDGVLTRRGTFQKFFTQSELRAFLESNLLTEAIPAAPGIFYVFRDENLRESFLASRYRRQSQSSGGPTAGVRFEQARELLEPLMRKIEDLGRLPEPDEFLFAAEVESTFGSVKRAFSLIRRVTGKERWDLLRRRRTEDLFVYLALAQFRKRPPISKLPVVLRHDIREFFGTYKSACTMADELLYQAGDASAVDEACQRSQVGKLLPNALYVHRSALESLDPLLRVYEGCARAVLGEVEGANVIKLHRFSGKVSYLVYPDFERDPHPALTRAVKLAMRSQELYSYEYDESANPPILHRKEAFLDPTHPLYSRFSRLTKQEERQGLLDDAQSIGTRQGWEERLQLRGFALLGHRLQRRQNLGTES